MLEEYKHKHETLFHAYSSLHVQLMNIRNGQPAVQSRTDLGVEIPFATASPCLSTPTTVGMQPIDTWQYFPVVPGYPA